MLLKQIKIWLELDFDVYGVLSNDSALKKANFDNWQVIRLNIKNDILSFKWLSVILALIWIQLISPLLCVCKFNQNLDFPYCCGI